ncbi:hypothetical protein EYF80_063789 [Liparis tanakae]|uniref:Uncharacterized protein n=1 Tax=Liparis tanakae TaxID=230148 RepID=A0A4Z2EC06_9TELE|nr:hypothetical protein EYF80_063789 [Liparis tanakae]
MKQYTTKGFFEWILLLYKKRAYRESRKMSFMSRLALNMNMLLCSLISVTALGGSEWPTATSPTFW